MLIYSEPHLAEFVNARRFLDCMTVAELRSSFNLLIKKDKKNWNKNSSDKFCKVSFCPSLTECLERHFVRQMI